MVPKENHNPSPMNTRMQMDIEVHAELDEALATEWDEFYNSVTHPHPRQSLPFTRLDQRHHAGICYAIGRIDGRIVSCGAFLLWRHRYFKSSYRAAHCMCGPLGDDPELILDFMEQLRGHSPFTSVGELCISPYWIEDEARSLTEMVGERGWRNYEQRGKYRKTGVIDLTLDHDQLLARYSKSARRFYRRAVEIMGVQSRRISARGDAERFYEIMEANLGSRNISFMGREYFLDLFESVLKEGRLGTLLGSYLEGELIGGTMNFRSPIAGIGRYLVMDGELIKRHRNLRLSPLLLMNSFLWSRESGCIRFDLEGYDDPENSPKSLQKVNEYKSKVAPRAVVRFADHKKINRPLIHLTGNTRQVVKSTMRGLRGRFKGQKSRPSEQ